MDLDDSETLNCLKVMHISNVRDPDHMYESCFIAEPRKMENEDGEIEVSNIEFNSGVKDFTMNRNKVIFWNNFRIWYMDINAPE